MTCIIGGKCKDGIVLVADRKVTYDDHPPSYIHPKLDSSFYPVVTGGAGSTDLYDEFKTQAILAIQPQHKQHSVTVSDQIQFDANKDNQIQTEQTKIQTSGIVRMFAGPTSSNYTFNSLQSNFESLVRKISTSKKALDINGTLEILTATQLSDIQDSRLTYITSKGNSDVPDYRSIGTSAYYSYVFLKPFYDNDLEMTMYQFAQIGYFIIEFLKRFDLDTDVGGQPQFWCIPNSGALFTDDDRPEWKKQYKVSAEGFGGLQKSHYSAINNTASLKYSSRRFR